jgi:HlyD family secretion protein
MKLKKILIISGVILVAAAITVFTVVRAQSGYTKVLTAKVVRENLVSIVSGTGQIKPKTYVNVGATSFGRITHLYVKEGDRVKKGQVVATVESVQAQAGVVAQQASIQSANTDIASYVAAENTAQATVDHSIADLNQKLLDWQRAQALYKAELIAKSEYDSKKAAYDTDVANRICARQAGHRRSYADQRQGPVEQDRQRRTLRWHRDEYAGARRRNGGCGYSKRPGEHVDDVGGPLRDHRRSQGR